MQNNDTESGTKKRQANEREIEKVKNGLPKVIGYWEMVQKEIDTLNNTCDNAVYDERETSP